MEVDINTIIEIVKATYGAAAGGALAVAAAAMYGLVKLIRVPLVQAGLAKIRPWLAWAAWPKWVCALVVFVLTCLGACFGAVALGATWLPALIGGVVAAFPVALSAMGIDGAVSAITAKPVEPAVNP